MKTKDYDSYYITDLIADLRDDAISLKNTLTLFDKLRKFFGVFSIIWGYISIALFTVYGIMYLQRTGEIVLPIISFIVCGIFLIVNTVLLILRKRSATDKKRYVTAKQTFRIFTVILKVAMTIITVVSLVGIADDPSTMFRTVWSVISMFWLGMTVAVDVASFIIRRVFLTLKEIAAERVRRTKAAFTNTANDVVKIARTVKDIGSGIKNIFSNKKVKSEKQDPEKENQNSDDENNDFFA